jgi:hypothetical protein
MRPDGAVAYRLFTSFGDEAEGPPSWFAGVGDVGVYRVAGTDWSAQRSVNETHMSNAGGTEQVASNSGSRGKFGRRTFRRLDLQADQDASAAAIGQRIVTNLANDRAQVTGMTLQPSTLDEVHMGAEAAIGEVVQLTINTLYGWSYTIKAQIFGISHEVTPETWRVSFLLDDTEIAQVGAYASGYSDGYDV